MNRNSWIEYAPEVLDAQAKRLPSKIITLSTEDLLAIEDATKIVREYIFTTKMKGASKRIREQVAEVLEDIVNR